MARAKGAIGVAPEKIGKVHLRGFLQPFLSI